jgi:micrococcal nuclease
MRGNRLVRNPAFLYSGCSLKFTHIQRITSMKFLVIFTALAVAAPAFAHKVVGVSDGNTLTLLVDEKPLRIRLANIDAPEKGQPFGAASRKALSELCLGKEASYKEQDVDHQGNLVAVVHCAGVEANRIQVEQGMAWVDPKYNKDLTFPGLEAMARRDRKGLWADADPMPPWEFRRPARKVKGPAVEKADESICFVDRRGAYRIVDGVKRHGC